MPRFTTANSLGDYTREFESFYTETEVKTKIMILDSNSKAYNIDRMLEFIASSKSVFYFFHIYGILGVVYFSICIIVIT